MVKQAKHETPIRRLRMEDELWHAAERIAQEQDRSASWIIRKALEEHIERSRAAKRSKGIDEARVPQPLIERLEKMTAKSGMSVGQMVQRAIEEFIAFNE